LVTEIPGSGSAALAASNVSEAALDKDILSLLNEPQVEMRHY
jgi:hypothetical protein